MGREYIRRMDIITIASPVVDSDIPDFFTFTPIKFKKPAVLDGEPVDDAPVEEEMVEVVPDPEYEAEVAAADAKFQAALLRMTELELAQDFLNPDYVPVALVVTGADWI
jgi:hypothetical protein